MGARKAGADGAALPAAAPASGSSSVPRVHSNKLLNDGMQLIIEHAGREYRLRVTSNGRLILTA